MLFPPRPSSSSDAPSSSPGFLVEHDAAFTPTLRTYLKRHVLRSKVKLGRAAEDDVVVTAAWRNPADVGEGRSSRDEVERAERWLEERRVGWDPRVVGMGYRWVAQKDDEQRASLLLLLRLSSGLASRRGERAPQRPADAPRHRAQPHPPSSTRSLRRTTTCTASCTPCPSRRPTFPRSRSRRASTSSTASTTARGATSGRSSRRGRTTRAS